MDYLRLYNTLHKKLWVHANGGNTISTIEAKTYLGHAHRLPKEDRYIILKEMEDMGMILFESRDIIRLLHKPKELQKEMIAV